MTGRGFTLLTKDVNGRVTSHFYDDTFRSRRCTHLMTTGLPELIKVVYKKSLDAHVEPHRVIT